MAKMLNTVARAYIFPADSAMASRCRKETKIELREGYKAEARMLVKSSNMDRDTLLYEKVELG